MELGEGVECKLMFSKLNVVVLVILLVIIVRNNVGFINMYGK